MQKFSKRNKINEKTERINEREKWRHVNKTIIMTGEYCDILNGETKWD